MVDLSNINDSDPLDPTDRRVHDTNYVINELKNLLFTSTDSFGNRLTRGTKNTVDVPSFYEFNEERHRLFQDDVRVLPEDIPTKFTDREGNYLLEPDAGEKLEIRTAERPRYVVGYEAEASASMQAETALGDGDTVTVGLADRQEPLNAAFFEINGGSDNRLVLIGQGSEVATDTFEFPDGVDETTPIRYEIQFNWYNVGRYLFRISFTDESQDAGSRQINTIVGELVVDDDFATGDAAQHIFHEIDAANSGNQISVGSYGYQILGDTSSTVRHKAARLTGLSYSGTGNYEALAGVRVDKPRGNVFTQLVDLSVFPDGGSGELLVIVVNEDHTDASDFSTPPEQTQKDSVIEQTTNITTYPDPDGNLVTDAADPNGYQIGFSSFESAGTGTNSRAAEKTLNVQKRPLYEDDVAVFLYKADTATERTVNLKYTMEQDW